MSYKRFVWKLVRLCGLGSVMMRIHPKSALKQCGWFKSFNYEMSVDRNGQPIPWWTYSCISFIADRLKHDMRVFEYGCGNSTVWLSQRVCEVISVENFPSWGGRVSGVLKAQGCATARVIIREDPGEFAAEAGKGHGLFQLIINDAEADRIRCAEYAVRAMTDDGVMLWDNTDGPDRGIIIELMASHGFRSISFSGMCPQVVSNSDTTIFYRDSNCLGI